MYRHGRVSATLDLLSVDMKTRTVVITRNAEAPMLLGENGAFRTVSVDSGPIGRYLFTKPDIREIPIASGLTIVLFTDGIPHSGRRTQQPEIDYVAFAERELGPELTAQEIADRVLALGIERDQGRPGDDMAVVAMRIAGYAGDRMVRRMQAQFPMP
jgi:serine phosphatase RsbU (regulator of sigma subunit)